MKIFDIKKILIPTDFSESAGNALRLAIQIAKINRAEIILLHIVTPFDITNKMQKISVKSDQQPLYNKAVKTMENELKRIEKEITEKELIKVEYIIKVELIIDEAICDVAEKEKADLIVMGTHDTKDARAFFAGKNTYLVIQYAE